MLGVFRAEECDVSGCFIEFSIMCITVMIGKQMFALFYGKWVNLRCLFITMKLFIACKYVLLELLLITISNNQLSVTSDYNCILTMLIGSSRNGRLEVTQFSVFTSFGTASVILRDALCNPSGLTAPGSLNNCPMCEGQRWVFSVPMMIWWHVEPPERSSNLG